ncbi:uncharacterized protein LOC125567850 [Nematostella vectensis]|uniref:uncharacterized protein LOC125567850 n=1 Tax=Nematostella vectensis TaxID=45351 RepID=UPI0020776BEF|nr:uncharacterized protein LOC125567850 [Nematostella vectensis]
MDIDPEIPDRENPFEPVDPGGDDEGESIPMASTSTHDPFRHHSIDETSFIHDVDEHTPLIRKEERRDNAWDRIREKFPKMNPAKSPFTATLDEYERVVVKLKRMGGRAYRLFDAGGELNEKLPPSIKNNLGPSAEEIIRSNEEEVAKREEKLRQLETKRTEVPEDQREGIGAQIAETLSEIEQLERENEVIEERMSLKDRVKAIFKKYGFTTIAVVTAVGVVIGVIVSNLKKGLTSVAKGVGNGLKTIGKKLGEILPGMVGAIASFIFRTAGEVVGFLAKNAWLLIVTAVLYFVERFKRRRKS